MLRVAKLCKSFAGRPAVDQVDFEVAAGETLCLIGSSGSGKTTTLRMLNRLVEPDSGSITLQNQDITALNPVKLRRGIGYVIQQIGLLPHLDVARNIGLLPELEGWPKHKIKARVSELLELMQLDPALAQRYPHELSGGQQQRIGVARALALNPPLILLDEPFAALDPLTRAQLQDVFLELQTRFGLTAILVTHDLAEAFKCGDKIALMHQGRLLQHGTALDFLTQPADAFVADFVRSQTGEQLLELPIGKLTGPADGLTKLISENLPVLRPDTPLRQALRILLATDHPALPVRDDSGKLLGALTRDAVGRLL